MRWVYWVCFSPSNQPSNTSQIKQTLLPMPLAEASEELQMQRIVDLSRLLEKWGCSIWTNRDCSHNAANKPQRMEIGIWGRPEVVANDSVAIARQSVWRIPAYPSRVSRNLEGWSTYPDNSFVPTTMHYERMPRCTISGSHGHAKDIGTCLKAVPLVQNQRGYNNFCEYLSCLLRG